MLGRWTTPPHRTPRSLHALQADGSSPQSTRLRILAEYEAIDRSARGALLRREGLYSSIISTWRQQRDRGAHEALGRPAGRQQADPRDREIARLKREVDRLAGELDKQRRVVEIQGKLSALLEQLATDSKADNGEQR